MVNVLRTWLADSVPSGQYGMSPLVKKGKGVLGIRRAAILLVILGEETSGQLIKNLTEEEVQAVSREIARIPSIAPETGRICPRRLRRTRHWP